MFRRKKLTSNTCAACKNDITDNAVYSIGHYNFCGNCISFEKADDTVSHEIILPKALFKLYDNSTSLPGDNVLQEWASVVLTDGGFLHIEENRIKYSVHSIGHNTGRYTTKTPVTFDQLPKLIERSSDEAAKKYKGMSSENWLEYAKEPKAQKKASKYPILRFGKCEWYILEQYDDQSVLLLSKYGIDARPLHNENVPIAWNDSTLCRWLNTRFISEYLFSSDKSALVAFDGNNKVSLLDEQLVEEYLKNDIAITVKPTPLAKRNGAFTYTYSSGRPDCKEYVGNGLAWLKDDYTKEAENLSAFAKCVYWDGSICMYPFDYRKVTVRPLIKLDLKKL